MLMKKCNQAIKDEEFSSTLCDNFCNKIWFNSISEFFEGDLNYFNKIL